VKFEAAAQACAQRAGVSFVPVFAHFGAGMSAHDGLHPNDAGHQLIYELVRPALDRLLNT
jgi:lysophospholipase L1-like esterase